ncbi:MAG: hypothetical protein ABI379_10555 [Rhodanobacter sp.]
MIDLQVEQCPVRFDRGRGTLFTGRRPELHLQRSLAHAVNAIRQRVDEDRTARGPGEVQTPWQDVQFLDM